MHIQSLLSGRCFRYGNHNIGIWIKNANQIKINKTKYQRDPISSFGFNCHLEMYYIHFVYNSQLEKFGKVILFPHLKAEVN